mgnify:CR=1 FL=1
MKKLFLVLLAGALFVACGNKAEEATEESRTSRHEIPRPTAYLRNARRLERNRSKDLGRYPRSHQGELHARPIHACDHGHAKAGIGNRR